jgi:hypothetical protein
LRIGGFEKLSFFELAIFLFFFNYFPILFALSPLKPGKNYGVEWMGLNFYEYCGFQPKITHLKHFGGECIGSDAYFLLHFDRKFEFIGQSHLLLLSIEIL